MAWMNREESKIIQWALVPVLVGIICWLFSRSCMDMGLWELSATIAVGVGSGAVAAALAQSIQRKVREHAERSKFSVYTGQWKRTGFYQNAYLGAKGQMVEKKRISIGNVEASTISYDGGLALNLTVIYDQGRGTTRSRIEFQGLNAQTGHGTYFYVSGTLQAPDDNDGLPHHGRYTLHLVPDEPNRLILFHDGLIPEPNAAGYEVWERVK